LFVFGSFFCIVFTSKLSATICNDYAYEIRKNLFSHVNKLSAKEIEIFGIPSLINRNTSDAVKVARGLEFALKLGITAPGAMIGGIIKISIDSSKGLDSQLAANTFTVAIVISIVVLLLSLGVIAAIILPRFKKQVKLLDELNEKARESISGVRVIRAFNAQSLHTKNFNEVNERNYKNNIILFFGTSSAFPIISSIINYITITIY
jgi:ATP-binding cassette subfamily B protein